jgi:dihydroorotate dehydrogenase electron transfer subunit
METENVENLEQSGKFEQDCEVIRKRMLAEGIHLFELQCNPDNFHPGQFVMVKADGHTLRRPISVSDVYHTRKSISIVFEVRGEGTAAIAEQGRKAKGYGHSFLNIVAPLGNGFTLPDPTDRVLIVGGGIGVPPLDGLSKYCNKPDIILGFKDESRVILRADFKDRAGKLDIQFGSIIELPEKANYDKIYACGPMPMLNAVKDYAAKNNIWCEVSLEERMGCGVGACAGCSIETVNGMKRVCYDGPVFNTRDLL